MTLPARGKSLDRLSTLLGVDRRRPWPWAPRWLRFWPFAESDRALSGRMYQGSLETGRALQAGRLVVADIDAGRTTWSEAVRANRVPAWLVEAQAREEARKHRTH